MPCDARKRKAHSIFFQFSVRVCDFLEVIISFSKDILLTITILSGDKQVRMVIHSAVERLVAMTVVVSDKACCCILSNKYQRTDDGGRGGVVVLDRSEGKTNG